MTCGHLGCSRKNFDGSGGNGHALAHFQDSKHPIVCRLGTITAEGTADIHCYSCDEQRSDPELAQHLSTFGIEITTQTKTEKTLQEMVRKKMRKY